MVNVVVLWNTLDMVAAPARLRRGNVEMKPQDIAPLSPVGREDINFFRTSSFAPSESVARDELRPPHNPDEVGSQDASHVRAVDSFTLGG
jgi:hypothetical protein